MLKPTLKQKLDQFILRYTNQPQVGNTDGNRGQCAGLVEAWVDELGLPHIWGNAKDLLDQTDLINYRIIHNTPTNYPLPGDIVVWDGTWGGGFGHTGICVTAHVMRLSAFQQNDPYGSYPHITTYGYGGVRGWIRSAKRH